LHLDGGAHRGLKTGTSLNEENGDEPWLGEEAAASHFAPYGESVRLVREERGGRL